MKNRKFIEKEVGVSAVIGVILTVAITVAIATTVYVYVSGMIVTDTIDNKVVITDTMQNYTWDVPENYTMELAYSLSYTHLYEEESEWYKFTVVLRSEVGPWYYTYWAWFNIETTETYLQLK